MTRILYKLFDRFFIRFEHYRRENTLRRLRSAGDRLNIQEPFYFSSPENISFGNNVSFGAFVHIWGEGGVTIGDNCMIASHTAITSVTHNPASELFCSENIMKPVVIGNNVWIGAHSVIFPGVTIGDNTVIGAGSIVNKSVESNAVYAGVPAKLLYYLNQFAT